MTNDEVGGEMGTGLVFTILFALPGLYERYECDVNVLNINTNNKVTVKLFRVATRRSLHSCI